MRSPAAAIGWELRRRHRWGALACAGYLLGLAVVRLLTFEPGRSAAFRDVEAFAWAVVIPLTAAFIYSLSVFSFGLEGDLAARRSMYPARMFTLPVPTAALAAWPMLYGSLTVVGLWLAARVLAIWPSDFEMPTLWPGLLAAVILCWTQALTWTSYPLRGLRVVVSVLWLALIDTVVVLALEWHAREPAMLALLAPHFPLAFLAASRALARARRGDVPDWRPDLARPALARPALARPALPAAAGAGWRDRFSSPERAHAWLEWRRQGRSLPVFVGLLLPFELGLLFLFADTPAVVLATLLGVLLTPPFMAGFAAAAVAKSKLHASDPYGLGPFVAVLPVTSASLVAARLRAAARSTLGAWLLVLVAIPPALLLSGTWPPVIERASRVVDVVGLPRAVAIALLSLSALVVATWKQLVQSLCIGLSGRAWLVKASTLANLALLVVIGPLASWILGNHGLLAGLWSALPFVLAALAGVKLLAGAWIASRLHRDGILDGRTLLVAAASWDLAVFALYGVLAWIVPALIVREHVLALIAILEVPLVRVAAAPLALAWNRHR